MKNSLPLLQAELPKTDPQIKLVLTTMKRENYKPDAANL
jgi:hypothetical protein